MASQPMSIQMRDLLIEHIDGPTLLTAGCKVGDGMTGKWDRHLRVRLLVTAVDRGFLVFDRKVSPTSTSMTDKGKEAICAVLADWADALTRANWDRFRPAFPRRARQDTEEIKTTRSRK